jgi:glycosyltransferase involved in cell wall biosynthesis
MRISAIIITRNEAAHIADCLAGLAFCDERIVVDCGSDDETVRLAQAGGARVETHAWEGFGRQKNYALSLASGDWVLSVDADERVGPELAAEIVRTVAKPTADAYAMPRLSRFCGRPMRHSGWYPDYVVRLFRRGRARFSDDPVHERVICEGPGARLSNPLQHEPVRRLEDALARMDRYSTAGAAMLMDRKSNVSFAAGILHGAWTFVRTYVLRGGFLDGPEGFLLAVANAEGTYYRYMKAWLMRRSRG